ncbi:hypothetical protein D9758_017916 [Tetrapyrgos nigripes]|uniref:Uncharacterized protein n=1 Tax=Tetrapyrgos nigripes TaxID=182062 RepID=A0A8H5AZF4_9AGAR|nr:hypothetical protein D9758_017916 [Tetrapyrgos nigripes]
MSWISWFLATGFDAITGGITAINVVGKDGVPIAAKWNNEGMHTYLGMTVANYPNLFFSYGPQGPTSFCNGPSCLARLTFAEMQCEWIINCVKHMQDKGYTRVEADREAEKHGEISFWTSTTTRHYSPSRKAGIMVPTSQHINEVVDKDYEGFHFSKKSA